jgi:hypothetical protein
MSELARVDVDVEEGSAGAIVEQPTIHDQAYWDQELDVLSQEFEPFRGVKLNEMAPAEMAEFVAFVWKAVLHERELLRQLALEVPTIPTKTPRKRTPKAPKPVVDVVESDPDAA